MVVLSSGERLPMFLDFEGMPLFDVTVYSLTQLRARNRAANTIESSLRSIMVLYIYLDIHKINIIERLQQGELLSLVEIESLVEFCHLPMAEISSRLYVESKGVLPSPVTTSLEKYRKRFDQTSRKEVLPASAANRLRIVRDYLVWLSLVRSSQQKKQSCHVESLREAQQLIVKAINSMMPDVCTSDCLDDREGLDQKSREKLLEVIEPDSEDNPWMEEYSRYRNALIMHWLYYHGLRRGELLGIRISDINFQESTVVVARRADDPQDPRRNQPNAKTRARKIRLSPGLRDMTEAYIMSHRIALPGARKHNFLFVASNSGKPMSISSLNKVFTVLSMKCPELPKLYPHIMRHTWNERFSEKMDKKKINEGKEKKMRSYLMGWLDTSGTAAIYTRRHVREAANKISLEMQKNMLGEDKNDE
jgi:integrase